ncbi:hypothetical protein PMIN06_013059 [Paraphaeosphaeria minitans]
MRASMFAAPRCRMLLMLFNNDAPWKRPNDVSPRVVLSRLATLVCRDAASYQNPNSKSSYLLSTRSNEEPQETPLCSSAVQSDGTCRAIDESQQATRRHCPPAYQQAAGSLTWHRI